MATGLLQIGLLLCQRAPYLLKEEFGLMDVILSLGGLGVRAIY